MNAPSTPSGSRRATVAVAAVFLWLLTFALGLQGIYTLSQLYGLFLVWRGSSVGEASTSSFGAVFFIAFGFLIFIIASTEYHLKRIGKPESWRLFGWTLAVELSIILLYNIL